MRLSGSSRSPSARVMALPVRVPTARLTFRMGVAKWKGVFLDAALTASCRNVQSCAEQREVLTNLFGDEFEEVLDELWLAGEALTEARVLCGDANRTRVKVTDAHHHAARDDERRGLRDDARLSP